MDRSSPTPPLWRSLVLRQFSSMMGHLSRPSHPFDFLQYYPNHNSKWLHLWGLHSLWLHVWTQWAAKPMDKRLPTPPPLSTLLDMPVWLTRYAPMTDHANKCAANVVNSPPLRRWCMYGAANGFYCLNDFLQPSGFWPTRAIFMARMSTGNPAAEVDLGPTGVIHQDDVGRLPPPYENLLSPHPTPTLWPHRPYIIRH
ncbi:hypothetical protein THRCLA_21580 [Thraustotheca clavata]|uniref:Uncharacterized protein n=1 Tax=Thraustotheca clavata TaxID=74557 RepID=A0A1V9ZV55_9STRA|nr:hypothetical protein THRCLA_21580 [Thraustotheca clavata]